jgi:putative tricarboxylic transport membrane protein
VTRAGRLSGVVLILLGVLSVVEALRMRDDWQGAKLMPAVIGTTLVLLGAAHFRGALSEAVTWPDPVARRRVALMFGALVLYVVALPWVGFLPSTAVFVLVLVRALGTYSWLRSVVVTAIIAVACHVVFAHWLGMPLPAGPLGV